MSDRESGLGDMADEGGFRTPGRAPRGSGKRSHLDMRVEAERERDERDQTQDRELTDDERVELFRDGMQQSILPDLPEFAGYHSFWATISNPRDTIQKRRRLGYELIRVEEFPGWDGTGITAGGVSGVVNVNEMIAMRLPMRLYQRYMQEAHHHAPLQEESKIVSLLNNMKAQAGQDLIREQGDGMAALVQRTERTPIFEG